MIALYPVEVRVAWRRRGWLALIGGVHLLALVAWQPAQRPPAASRAGRHTITYILTPVQVAQPGRAVRKAPAVEPVVQTRKGASQAASIVARAQERLDASGTAQGRTVMPEVAPSTSPAPAQAITQTLPPVDPFAEPAAKPDGDLMQRSLKSAAAIDKQLRKEAWNRREKKIANDTTVLGAKIASAYVGNNGVMSTEELTMPDGRLMTKVRTPGGGSFCAYKESNALTGGRDPFRDGIRTMVTNCPR
jgi:hypothetical protein